MCRNRGICGTVEHYKKKEQVEILRGSDRWVNRIKNVTKLKERERNV